MVIVVLFPSTSRADDRALAKPQDAKAAEHLAQGNRLYNVRKFEDAAQSYVAGALVESAPIFDYNLGQCYRQLGRYQDAIWHYKRFLNRGQPAAELRGFVEGFIAQMEAELAKKATTQPPIEAAGTTAPPPDASTVSATRAQPQQLQTGSEPQQPQIGSEPAQQATSSLTGRRKLAIAAWSLGAIGLGAAVGFELSARSTYDDAQAETTNQTRRDDLEHSANNRRTTAIVAGSIGLAAIAGGTLLWITGRPDERALALAPRVGRDSAELVFSGRF